MTHLNLPEVIFIILGHLTTRADLLNAMLVNRRWYSCGSCILWRDVTFNDDDSRPGRVNAVQKLELMAWTCDGWSEGPARQIDFDEEYKEMTARLRATSPTTREDQSLVGGRKQGSAQQMKDVRRKSGRRTFSLRIPARLQSLMSLLNPNPPASRSTTKNTKTGLRHATQNYATQIKSLSVRKVKDSTINTHLQSVAKRACNLSQLELYICDYVQDATIMAFVDGGIRTSADLDFPSSQSPLGMPAHPSLHLNTNLIILSLPGCSSITDAAVSHIALFCPLLEHLDLRACNAITDTSLIKIASGCPQLRHLNVGRIRDHERVTVKSIAPLAKKTKLKVLGLAGCAVTDECMTILAKDRGSDIERISINHCSKVTNASLYAFLNHCPRLSVFEMKACAGLNDWGVVAQFARKNVLLTLCEQQQYNLEEWGKRSGMTVILKRPFRGKGL